jgi:hypothetical protein
MEHVQSDEWDDIEAWFERLELLRDDASEGHVFEVDADGTVFEMTRDGRCAVVVHNGRYVRARKVDTSDGEPELD